MSPISTLKTRQAQQANSTTRPSNKDTGIVPHRRCTISSTIRPATTHAPLPDTQQIPLFIIANSATTVAISAPAQTHPQRARSATPQPFAHLPITIVVPVI